MNLFQFKPFK